MGGRGEPRECVRDPLEAPGLGFPPLHVGGGPEHRRLPHGLQQRLAQLAPLYRLRVHGRHAALQPPVAVGCRGVGADAEDRGPPVLPQPPDLAGGVVPVHDRHVDVHEDGVVRGGRLTNVPQERLEVPARMRP